MMNNGGGRVFSGQRTQNQMGAQNNPQQQQQQQFQNPFAMLTGHAAKYANNINNQANSMASLYAYGPSRTNYAAAIGLDENMGEEVLKKQAMTEGGMVAQFVINLCLQGKSNSPMYTAWMQALERFKSVTRGGPKDVSLEQFANDVQSNQALRNFVLPQIGVQFGSYMAYRLMCGDESVKGNTPVLADILYKSSIDILTLQFIDHLEYNPQAYYKMSVAAKKAIAEREDATYQQVAGRYLFVEAECPYSKGKMSAVAENTIMHNPLLDVANPGDLGMGGSIFDNAHGSSVASNYNQPPNDDFGRWIAQQANRNQQQAIYGESSRNNNQSNVPSYDNFDKPELTLADLTFENRMSFNLHDFATKLGNSEYWIMHRIYVDYLTKVFRMDDGSSYSMRDTNVLGKLACYRFDWQAGTFNYRFLDYSLSSPMEMNDLISDPSVLLPLMYEDDGVQKTTWDPKVMETSEFIRDGYIVPMEEMKELKTQPNLLVGSRPMNANLGNDNTISRIDAFTESHDPTSKLDAFVLPMANTRQWTLPTGTDMDQFYSCFKLMVRGNKEEKTDTVRVIRTLRGQVRDNADKEFSSFLNSYLTNLVNRWLIEARGYVEDKKDTSGEYLRTGDIFQDLEDLVECLRERDHPTLRAFMDYSSNEFMRNGIEILLSKEDTQKEFEEQFKKEDEETRAVMMTSAKRKIIFKRDSVFINMIKLNGPVQLDAVVLKESINPTLFAVVRKAIEIAGRHFSEYPQVLMKFRKDEGGKVWAVTRSGLDPESVFVLRAVSPEQDFTHLVPVCD